MTTTHVSRRSGVSQNTRILEALQEARGDWVSMPQLVHASGSYAVHSRISDLRKEGHQIEQKNERDGAKCKSSYKLES